MFTFLINSQSESETWIDAIVQEQMLKSPTLPRVMVFFAFILQGLLGSVWGLMAKTKNETKPVLFSLNTLYHSNNWFQMGPHLPPQSPVPPFSGSWKLPAFSALCLSLATSPMPAATVPVVVSCVAWWSQWDFEIPVIWLMLSELSTWAPARGLRTEGQTRKPSDEAVLQESARAHFFMEVRQGWHAMRGHCWANMGWVTLRVCCTCSPFGLWFLCVLGD